MIHIKSDKEILAMQEGGEKLNRVLKALLAEVKPGLSPLKLDEIAEKLILKEGGVPSFKKVPGYKWTTCMCINDIVVHGIPYQEPLAEGDVLGLDVGIFYKGFHTDSSWSVVVGDANRFPEKKKLLEVGEKALEKAIAQVKVGNRIGHISQSIQKDIEGAGYSIIPELVGHGVGRKLHEDPEIPGLLRSTLEKTPIIKPGMALAVEVIYSQGEPDIYLDEDGWTIRTKDGTLSGLFEKTVIATNHGVLVLT